MLIAKSHFALVFGSSIFFHNIYAAFFEEAFPAAFPSTPPHTSISRLPGLSVYVARVGDAVHESMIKRCLLFSAFFNLITASLQQSALLFFCSLISEFI